MEQSTYDSLMEEIKVINFISRFSGKTVLEQNLSNEGLKERPELKQVLPPTIKKAIDKNLFKDNLQKHY